MSDFTQRWALPPVSSSSSSKVSFPNPPGYAPPSSSSFAISKKSSSKTVARSESGPAKLEALRQQRAWDLAIGPAKAVPMQGFMVYMSGGGVQIFSLMIVFQLIKGAISGVMGVNTAFAPFEQQSASHTPSPSASINSPGPAKQNFTLQKIETEDTTRDFKYISWELLKSMIGADLYITPFFFYTAAPMLHASSQTAQVARVKHYLVQWRNAQSALYAQLVPQP
ncbi:MAG: hypothetical protein CYPHOPRED_005813 [Cyphobasidiales sp. Tagirdzhanova-0007]|nr:MAG: hypothetical protein CYPHOPRED_005813 [Cyphobasidiales sp. Tagirdzhanova-0007]